jgi:co-chaperonin GroES (HSP10)
MSLQIEEKDLEKFIMVGDRVLIKPKNPLSQTQTGLYLPPSVQENEKIHSGYIVKVGPGTRFRP